MNNKALRTLEYNKIIEQLTEYASSTLGKELCKHLLPSTDFDTIISSQKETSDALTRLYQKGSISFSGARDVRGSLKRLEVGSILNAYELLQVADLLETTNRIKSYSRKENIDAPSDSLESLFEELQPFTPISNEIRRCIISEEDISDDATSNLKQIRRSMNNIHDKVRTQLNSMVNGSSRTYLQDAVVTLRNNRYCLPVKTEYRNQIPGMIHDQSSTGSTIFVEPMAVVKLNNDLKELEIKEQKEIEVVLANLSVLAGAQTVSIGHNLSLLIRLDFIFAKASLSKSLQGSEPIFNTRGYINIKKGRHPLLDKKKVVPIDVHLGDEFNLLIVTGPNTGGKTVSIKTVGLFTLMGQAGLHIPAFDRSELALFDDIFADIGDEQSIEQSLSTFSSHMTNIISILEKVTSRSLVLFDELGAGTDPTEGAALATSILTYLHKRKIRTMATTHYSELKVFALSTPGVQNASCEFNVETLRPTYRLLIGVPGKSNAFAISSKLGLPDYIIEEAKKHISEQDISFEDVITDLENSRLTIENERIEIANYRKEISQLKQKLEEQQDKLAKNRDKILREAHEEAALVLGEAKEYADETIRKFNKFGKENISIKEMELERTRIREQMNTSRKNLGLPKEAKVQKIRKPNTLKIGDSVKVISLNLTGTVHTLPNSKGILFVQMGILRSQVNINDLELLDEATITTPSFQKTSSGKIKMAKSASIKTEINLIGRTVDDALMELDKYLDDAYLAHIQIVRVVHGKGTGTLRKAVQSHLKRLKYVSSYRLGEFGEGDSGVTVVELKK
jgi:MutS2 family protein